jgi:hypothetical protein
MHTFYMYVPYTYLLSLPYLPFAEVRVGIVIPSGACLCCLAPPSLCNPSKAPITELRDL